jgi:hypothetical protein
MPTRTETGIISHEIVRRLLLKQSVADISQAMGIREKTLQNHILRPAFQALLEQMQAKLYKTVDQQLGDKKRNLVEEIALAAETSMDRLVNLLDSASDQVRMHVAQDFLDRAGLAKVQVIKNEGEARINPIDMQILLQALDEDRRARERAEADPEGLKGAAHPMAGKLDDKG